MIKDVLSKSVINNLPFSPNEQQNILINILCDYILSNENNSIFLMKGYAGTGKTSLVGAFVKALSFLNKKTILLAPTGRAAKVFSNYSDHPAFTIHKKIYRQKSFSAEMNGFNLSDNLHKDTLFIVDESSMIGNYSESTVFGTGHLLDDLIEYVYAGENCKLLLLGDIAQLPPVGQPTSPALDINNLRGYGLDVLDYSLTNVARQKSESGILFNATMLREIMDKGEPYPLPQLKTSGFNDVIKVSGTELIDKIASSYSNNGFDQSIIITRSNKRANQFNQGIRNQILFREDEISSGDLLMVTKNNYFWSKDIKEIDFIANGDIMQVKRVRSFQEIYGFRFVDLEVTLPDYDVEMDVKIILDTLHQETPSLSPELNNKLFMSVVEDYSYGATQREVFKKVKEDPFFNALQVKYGYAVTCHKAQGGQWSDVFLDMGYINKEQLGLDFYRWLYTAFTRATNKIYLVNIEDDFLEQESKG
ncbi:MAG: AAA family ATPase [Bacteroidales bacterium]|nr:AAA family ATPase [Bacteroidales bacterium]